MATNAADLLRDAMDAAGVTIPSFAPGWRRSQWARAGCRAMSRGAIPTPRTIASVKYLGAGSTSSTTQTRRFEGRRSCLVQLHLQRREQRWPPAWHTEPDDGFNFRGRGFIQLTGRGNYARYAAKIGRPDLMDNPDLANDPETAARLAVAYILDRYHGGGFEAMMRSVGNNTPDIAATKERFFEQFMASGEFAAGSTVVGVAPALDRRHQVMAFQSEWNAQHPDQTRSTSTASPGRRQSPPAGSADDGSRADLTLIGIWRKTIPSPGLARRRDTWGRKYSRMLGLAWQPPKRGKCRYDLDGWVAERLKAPVLKTLGARFSQSLPVTLSGGIRQSLVVGSP